MGKRKPRAFKMVEAVLVASLFSLIIASAAECEATGSSSVKNAIATSICELISHPERFKNRTVRVRADFESDGLEHWSLVNAACVRGGVMPAGGVFDPTVAPALLDALRHGCSGTMDKQITATWRGIYRWEPRNRPGFVKRWLDVEEIKELVVVPKQGGASCPPRP